MPATWFTADTHFGHRHLLGAGAFASRPFASMEEHDETLIANWNDVVGARDLVYHLGDFALGPKGHAEAIFPRLRGRKALIVGNHDKAVRRLPWAEQHEWHREVTVEGRHVTLSHFPMISWPRCWHGALHLYGHLHGKIPGTRRSADVGVDLWGFRPVSLTEIVDSMALAAEYPPELWDHPDVVRERAAEAARRS